MRELCVALVVVAALASRLVLRLERERELAFVQSATPNGPRVHTARGVVPEVHAQEPAHARRGRGSDIASHKTNAKFAAILKVKRIYQAPEQYKNTTNILR